MDMVRRFRRNSLLDTAGIIYSGNSLNLSQLAMSLIKLNEEQISQVFSQVKEAFSDFKHFEELVAERLMRAIRDSCDLVIDFETTDHVAKKYYSYREYMQSEELKLLWKKIDLIFRFAYVAIVARNHHIDAEGETRLRIQFQNSYPEFLSSEYPPIDGNEFELLYSFWKKMNIALTVIKAQGNKGALVYFCGLLEGLTNPYIPSGGPYITGSGQRTEVSNRVLIYEREGKVEPEPRDWRAERAAEMRARKPSAPPRKKKKASTEDASTNRKPAKTANEVVLTAEQIYHLLHGRSLPQNVSHAGLSAYCTNSSSSSSSSSFHPPNRAGTTLISVGSTLSADGADSSLTEAPLNVHAFDPIALLRDAVVSDAFKVHGPVPSGSALKDAFN